MMTHGGAGPRIAFTAQPVRGAWLNIHPQIAQISPGPDTHTHTPMNALIALLIRQGLAACGGFFAAHHITGDSTTSIVVGLIMLLTATLWSWIAKMLHLDDASLGSVTGGQALRTFVGAVVSQGITAASAYFAVDANNPELFGVALVNVAASKFGLQQKLAQLGGKDALKIMIFSCLFVPFVGCSSFTQQDAITFGKRVAVSAGETAVMLAEMQLAVCANDLMVARSKGESVKTILAKQLALSVAQEALKAARKALANERVKLDAKQPRDVQPGARNPVLEGGPPQATSHPGAPARVTRPPSITIPRHGVLVAASLRHL